MHEANRITGAILNAPDTFFDLLAPVFRSWLVHGTVTLSLLACAFLPLFKDQGSRILPKLTVTEG